MREDVAGDAAADARARTSGGSPSRSARPQLPSASQPALVAAVILIVLILTVLPYACADPGAHVFANVAVAGVQFQASPTATKTPTRTPSISPSPTTTVTSGGSGSLTLVSPANAQGPVGANLTLSGNSWGTKAEQTVSLSASATTCSGSGTTSLGEAQLDSDGGFTTTVVWPASLASPGAAYALCATSDGAHFATAPQSYRVRSAAPPALALSLSTVGVGQQTQIGGANFVGAASVTVTLTTAQGTRTLATVKPDPKDGSFTLTYSPTARDLGAANLSAASTPDGDAPSALQASAQLQIVAAAPTATTPPSIPTVASARPTTTSTASGSSLAASVLLMVGSLLVVLFLIGAVAWIFLMPVRARRRRGAAARSRIGAWGSADSSYGFAPPHPLDDSSAGSASYPTLYPHDAPTVGPAREWRAPSHAGGAPRAAQGRSWASSSSRTPSPRRRSNGTWAPSESEARPATSRAPGNLDLPSLDPGASQASTSESATFDEQRWDR